MSRCHVRYGRQLHGVNQHSGSPRTRNTGRVFRSPRRGVPNFGFIGEEFRGFPAIVHRLPSRFLNLQSFTVERRRRRTRRAIGARGAVLFSTSLDSGYTRISHFRLDISRHFHVKRAREGEKFLTYRQEAPRALYANAKVWSLRALDCSIRGQTPPYTRGARFAFKTRIRAGRDEESLSPPPSEYLHESPRASGVARPR